MAEWVKVFPSAADTIPKSVADSTSPTGFGYNHQTKSQLKTFLDIDDIEAKAIFDQVNVKDYCVCNGVVDNTADIQSLIDDNTSIYIPEDAICKITQLTISESDVKIYGGGTLYIDMESEDSIDYADYYGIKLIGDINQKNILIDGIKFTGIGDYGGIFGTTISLTAGWGDGGSPSTPVLTDANYEARENIIIKNCTFESVGKSAIFLTNCNADVMNVIINGCDNSDDIGVITVRGCNKVNYKNIKTYSWNSKNLNVSYAKNVTIENILGLSGLTTPMVFYIGYFCENIIVSNIKSVGATPFKTSYYAKNIIIDNVIALDSPDYSFIQGSINVSLTNSYLHATGKNALQIYYHNVYGDLRSNDIRIHNCKIENATACTTNTEASLYAHICDNIYITNSDIIGGLSVRDVDVIEFDNCRFDGTNAYDYMLYLRDMTNVIFETCKIKDGVVGGYLGYLHGDSKASTVFFRNNIFQTQNDGQGAIYSSYFTGGSITFIDNIRTDGSISGIFSFQGGFGGSKIAKYIDLYMDAAPTSGRWYVGDKVYNTAPTAGGTIGWVCTTAGTPGTWKTFGAITA